MKVPRRGPDHLGLMCALAFCAWIGSSAHGAANEPAQIHRVEIKRFAYEPDHLEVRPGDTIIWINRDIAPHTASEKSGVWTTGRLKREQSEEMIVPDPLGTVEYFCKYHPHMKARIVVRK